MPKFLQRRGKLPERSGGDGAPASVPLRGATLRCEQAPWAGGELEFQRWYRNSETRSPLVRRDKKKRESWKYSPSLRQTRGRCVIREQRRLKRDKYKGESSRRVQVIPALRSKGCADGIRTWKQQPRVGGSERPGQMQAEKAEAEAIEEKRYNFAALLSFLRVFSLQRSCAPWRGTGARGSPVDPAPLQPRVHWRSAAAPLSSLHAVKEAARADGSCSDAPTALSDAFCLGKFSRCCVRCV